MFEEMKQYMIKAQPASCKMNEKVISKESVMVKQLGWDRDIRSFIIVVEG
jgi:hypothetical protein